MHSVTEVRAVQLALLDRGGCLLAIICAQSHEGHQVSEGWEELTCHQPFLQSQSICCHAFHEPAAAKRLPTQHQNMMSLPLNWSVNNALERQRCSVDPRMCIKRSSIMSIALGVQRQNLFCVSSSPGKMRCMQQEGAAACPLQVKPI